MARWTVDDSDFRSGDDIQPSRGRTERVVERVSTKHNDPCLASAKDDEPIFVLRAQDVTAGIVVIFWILCTMIVGLFIRSDVLSPSNNTLRAAFEQALRMRAWKHRKLPD